MKQLPEGFLKARQDRCISNLREDLDSTRRRLARLQDRLDRWLSGDVLWFGPLYYDPRHGKLVAALGSDIAEVKLELQLLADLTGERQEVGFNSLVVAAEPSTSK